MSKEKKELAVIKPEVLDAQVQKAIVLASEVMETDIVSFVMNEPFFAFLIQGMSRNFTIKLPTLGVSVTDKVNLYVNPFFYLHLNKEQRLEILRHEVHHVINNHFARFRDLEPTMMDETNKKSIKDKVQDMMNMSDLNKAADAAINEYLPNLPKKFNLFDDKGIPLIDDKGKILETGPILVSELKKKFPKIEPKQTTEYYYSFFKNNKDKNGEGQGQPQVIVIDDHSLWHEGDQSQDEITNTVKEVVNKAVEKLGDRNVGNLPVEIMEAINKLNFVPKDWRSDIQRFSARCSELLIERSRKKRNRRYGILHPGVKVYPKLNLALALDISGSVCDESLGQFHAEMVRLHNMGIEITVIQCDCKVHHVEKFDPKKPFKVYGRGGTAFKPVFDRIEKDKMEIDGLIYFTDGACGNESLKKPRYPVLWALTAPFQLDGSVTFGSKTKVEIRKKSSRQ